MSPWVTGWATSAVAAPLGEEPWPASLENRPRLVPFRKVAKKPPAVPARPALRWKAPATMSTSTPGTRGAETMMTTRTTPR